MKFLKIIAGLCMVLLLIAVVAVVSLVTFVSPNRFKPLIVEQVKKQTGRDLVIDGDLSWTIVPTLGVKIGHLQLNNTANFKQQVFAELDSATISVKLLPLLHKKIESSGITLNGLKLNLIKNGKGQVNWADLHKSNPEGAPKLDSDTIPKNALEEHPIGSSKRAAFGLAVSGIDVTHATIHWVNEQAKQEFAINNLDLHVKEITLSQPIPFKTSFAFASNNPALSGQITLSSDIALNLEKEVYALRDIILTTKINKENKHFSIVLKGDAEANLAKQQLQLDNLRGDISNLKLSGKVTVSDLSSKPFTKGHLSIEPTDMKKWLKDLGQDVAALDVLSNLSGDFDFTAGTSLQSVNLKGGVKISEIKSSKIHINNIDARTTFQKGVLDVSPVTASFYQGNLDGSAKVNLNSSTPHISLNAKLNNIQAEPLMADLAASDKIKITGTGNVDIQVTTLGANADAITKNLNGNAKLSFNNGILQGLDVGYIIENAMSLARKQSLSGSNSNQTPFGTLTATALIRNGIVTNNDLKMDSPRFVSNGAGTINLVNKTIKYQLDTKFKKEDNEANQLSNIYGLSIPITITGDLTSPSVGLDSSRLMKAVADQQMQKAKASVKEKIAQKIQDKLPDNVKQAAGDLLNNLLGN